MTLPASSTPRLLETCQFRLTGDEDFEWHPMEVIGYHSESKIHDSNGFHVYGEGMFMGVPPSFFDTISRHN